MQKLFYKSSKYLSDMFRYTISELQLITGARIIGDTNSIIQRISIDSRKSTNSENTLFIAIKGQRHDGHLYISDMATKGTKNFLISDESIIDESPEGLNFLVVEDTIVAFQEIASYHRARFDIPVIAITGSNGKTIVKEWLSQALGKKMQVTRSPRSYNSQIGVPLSVLLINDSTETGIFEAGISQSGEMSKLESIIRPTLGIITNIGEAHQENFKSLLQKTEEKLKLFIHCKSLYYCRDHELIHQTVQASGTFNNIRKICWSTKEKACNLYVQIVHQDVSSTTIKVKNEKIDLDFHLPYTDKASIENSIQIVNFLIDTHFDPVHIVEMIKTLQPVAMRLEQVRGRNNNLIINDAYNSDINSLEIALDFLNQQHFESHSLILSDIVQSGLSDENLCQQIASLVIQSDIDTFIGIGEKLSKNQKSFKNTNACFFASTEDFLKSDKIQEFSNEALLIKGARKYNFEDIVAVMSEKNHTTLLEINLTNLISNLNYFRSKLKGATGIMVMVKALAYGSGSYEIANLLQHEKVDYLGVAFTDEGLDLRKAGISLPIMVMSPGVEDFKRLIEYDLEPEIYNIRVLKRFIEVASSMQVTEYPVHVKIDTGMHRLGFQEHETDELISLLTGNNYLHVKWLFSHLAASDSPNHDDFSRTQIKAFNRIHKKLSDALGYTPLKHILNSAGIERFPEAHFDMVRLGIGLHGISSMGKDLLPVSTLKTHISQIKKISEGETVGYNRSGKVFRDIHIAILPIGYADGLTRKFGNGNGQVVIQNELAPFIGDICMDMSMVDISGLNCQEGDEVIVFGPQNPITKLARQIETIPYEILTNISSRVKRVFIKD
jgi:Alr-MurF fusion protein